MKKITLLMLMLGFTSFLSAQCLTAINGQYPSGTVDVATCDGLTQNSITGCGYGSEYSVVNVTAGETYTFGSSVATDVVTISTDSGATAEAFGIGGINNWVSTISGEVWFYTNLDDGACGAESVCRTRYVICGIPPTCIAPTAVLASNITTTSATISWTESTTVPGNYEFYVSDVNTAPTASTPATGAEAPGSLSTELTSLTTATTYYVWVRSVCSSTDTSGWSAVTSFTTLCDAVTEFTEGFDDAVAFPSCWAKVGTGGSASVQASASAISAPNNLYLASWSTTDLGVVSMIPVSNAGDGTHRLRFSARGNFSFGASIEVGYLTNPADDTSFVGVQTFTTTSTTVYDSFSAILGTAPGANQVLAFRHTGDLGYSVLIDDVIWEPLPSCVEPTPVTVSGITSTSADLSWTASVSTPSGYEYVLDNLATDPTVAGTSTTSLMYTATSLTPTTSYYFHVRSNCSVSSNSVWVTIPFTTFATPPANDNCANAVALTVNTDLLCGTVTPGTTLGATLSMAATPCFGTPDDDVWYSFVATATSHVIKLTNVAAVTGTSTDMYMQLLSGACGTTTSLMCSDPDSMNATGLTVGATYYVRVYSYFTTSTDTFNICVGTPPAPPANDDCANAVALTVNSDLLCGTVTSGTTTSATMSMASTPCFGTPDDDVWYSFVATATSHVVTLTSVAAATGTSTDMYMQLLSGACGTTTSIMCSDPDSMTATGLTVGATYYVRVYSYGTSSTDTFNICVGTPPPPPPAPAYDTCAGAIALTPGGVFADHPQSGTIYGANTTAGITPSCQSNVSADVWYSVVVPAAGSLKIETQVASTNTMTDSVVVAFSGTCGALTALGCDDDGGPAGANNFMSILSLTGLTPSSTIYVGVWKYNATAPTTTNSQFQISAYDPSLANNSFDNTGFTFYPNPVKDVLNLSYSKNIDKVQVINLLGQEMIAKSINGTLGQIDMSHLAAGTYLVKVTADNQVKTIKVIKQ